MRKQKKTINKDKALRIADKVLEVIGYVSVGLSAFICVCGAIDLVRKVKK